MDIEDGLLEVGALCFEFVAGFTRGLEHFDLSISQALIEVVEA